MKVDKYCKAFGHSWRAAVPGSSSLLQCSRCLMSKEIHADGSHTYLGMPTLEDALADMDEQDAEWEDILPALDDDPGVATAARLTLESNECGMTAAMHGYTTPPCILRYNHTGAHEGYDRVNDLTYTWPWADDDDLS